MFERSAADLSPLQEADALEQTPFRDGVRLPAGEAEEASRKILEKTDNPDAADSEQTLGGMMSGPG
jgi:hypothetical protein